jgi:hypothetical protein
MLNLAASSVSSGVATDVERRRRRARWLKRMHQWHWISSAICLVGMILFAITGITLNHAGSIEATPHVQQWSGVLPASLRATLATQAGDAVLPSGVRRWLRDETGQRIPASAAEWSEDEIYLSLPRAGGDAWLAIDRASGQVDYERTDRGWVALANDLHKGRNTGTAWSLFLDIFAVACLVFCLTGLVLLKLHAGNRPSTWPMVAAGLVIPILLVIALLH